MSSNPEATFDELVREGSAVPVAGWDFSWFAGRATEQRPSWGYVGLIGERMAGVHAALDVQTGGGEVLATIPTAPAELMATESWPPNIPIAQRNLRGLGAVVTEVDDQADLPFPDGRFDLVVSRHPTLVRWEEIARVLAPGGTYLSQQVGSGSVRELTEAMMGPAEVDQSRSPERAAALAESTGLAVVDLRREALRMEFYDIAAVIVFLRKVVWTVPGFTVEKYVEPLARLHEQIQTEGPFVARSQRFLIEAHKP